MIAISIILLLGGVSDALRLVDDPRMLKVVSHENQTMRTAVCIDGQIRTFGHLYPHILKQYEHLNAELFVHTNLNKLPQEDLEILRGKSNVHLKEKSKKKTFEDCRKSVKSHEQDHNMQFDWVVRQRADAIGCTPPLMDEWPKTNKTVLVPKVDAKWDKIDSDKAVHDSWALFTRDLLDIYDHSLAEKGLARRLKENKATIWRATKLCYFIVRGEEKKSSAKKSSKEIGFSKIEEDNKFEEATIDSREIDEAFSGKPRDTINLGKVHNHLQDALTYSHFDTILFDPSNHK